MFIQAAIISAIALLIAVTSLANVQSHTRANLHREADSFMTAALTESRTELEKAVASFSQANGGSLAGFVPPTTGQTISLCPPSTPCRFKMTTRFESGYDGGGQQKSLSQANTNQSLSESEVAVIVHTDVLGPIGPATREQVVRVQAFLSTPPGGSPQAYARTVGVQDMASGVTMSDTGGLSGCAGTGAGCDAQAGANADTASPDTRLHAYVTCTDTGAVMCGSPANPTKISGPQINPSTGLPVDNYVTKSFNAPGTDASGFKR